MRKHDVRKWLHAILDLLPVILIPVFMIYSHRHTIDSGSIQVPQNKVVDFNQNVENGNFIDGSNWQKYFIDNNFTIENNKFIVTDFSLLSQSSQLFQLPFTYFNVGDIALIKIDIEFNNVYYANISLGGGSYINESISSVHNEFRYTMVSDSNEFSIYLNGNSNNTTTYLSITNVQCFNLTKMFGVGNEPTIQQFNQWYQDDYYDYTLSHKELLKNTSTITYSDTDIMSQFTYQLYNSVDKYFNMGNVFHLNEVYDWFNLNIFNGNAPIYIYIVYQIVLYELIMDLLMLLYALFMWFIDMIQKLMDKPLNSVK